MLKASISLIKDLKKQKHDNSSLLFLDNVKIIKDALNNGQKAKYLLVEDETKITVKVGNDCQILKVDHKTIEQLSDCKTPQGVVCVVEYTQHTVKKPTANFLVLDRLQDPGNVGTLIRTACACGFDSVFLVDSVKQNNSKLIRSSVGTIFQINVYSLSNEEFISLIEEWGLKLIATDMNGENIFNFSINEPVGVIIGNEGQGISEQLQSLCCQTVKIPMKSGVESLNASISGAIIMYQLNKEKFLK